MEFKNNNVKIISLSNIDIKNMKDIDVLVKKFFLFNKRNLELNSKWIFIHHDKFCIENIIGFMELNRYPIVGGVTIADKEPLPFDIFEKETFVDYKYENTLEVERISKLDTFVLINNVEILKENRLQGIGSLMYSYLEENILTEEDSLIEMTRTIDGRNCNLLNKIEKVPKFTNLEELFNSL